MGIIMALEVNDLRFHRGYFTKSGFLRPLDFQGFECFYLFVEGVVLKSFPGGEGKKDDSLLTTIRNRC
jgi:hypothetical protein